MTQGDHTVRVSADELLFNVTSDEVDEKLDTLYPRKIAEQLDIELEDGEDPTENSTLREFVAKRIGRRRLHNVIDGSVGNLDVSVSTVVYEGPA